MEKDKTKKEETPVIDDSNEPMVLTKGQWKAFQEDYAKLKTGQRTERPKLVTSHIATLRFHKDKPVVWYGNARQKKEDGEKVGVLDIKLYGDDKPVTVNHLDFLNTGNSVSVEILNQKAIEKEEVVDRRLSVNLDEHFQKSFRAEEIVMKVRSVEYEVTVKVLDGEHKDEEYTLPANCFNQ